MATGCPVCRADIHMMDSLLPTAYVGSAKAPNTKAPSAKLLHKRFAFAKF